MIRIQQAAPGLRIARFRAEIDIAIGKVLAGGQYVLGAELERFEQAFAAYIGVDHCVGVASGTDALALSLRGLGIGPGDEVITVALTAAATAHAILQCGATPCFVDVDPVTRCMDPAAVTAAITPRTRAVIPVHLYGYPADAISIAAIASRHGLAVVEDCAQAHGALIGERRIGSFGAAGAFSFYPTKNLGCIGDGGAIVTRDAALARKLRALRYYGWTDAARVSELPGFNSRLDDVQAAVLNALLPHLDQGNRERRQLAAAYREQMIDLGFGLPVDDPGCVYHQFAITVRERDQLCRYLSEREGIATAVHYTPPLHRQPAFNRAVAGSLPCTEELSRTLLSLPIQPEAAQGDLAHTAMLVREGILRWKTS